MLEVLLSHREHIARVCQEDIATFLVFGHILIFALLEVLQFCIVVTLYPACLVEMNGFPARGTDRLWDGAQELFPPQCAARLFGRER